MKRDFSQPVLNVDGKPVYQADGRGTLIEEDGKKIPYTFRDLATRCLLSGPASDPGDEKNRRGSLAVRLMTATGLFEITPAELATVQAACDQYGAPLEVFRMREFLNTDPPAPSAPKSQPMPEVEPEPDPVPFEKEEGDDVAPYKPERSYGKATKK